jgi:prolyl-tRNA synthetase
MVAESELLGIPHRMVLSDTHADNGNVEYKARNNPGKIEVPFDQALKHIQQQLA